MDNLCLPLCVFNYFVALWIILKLPIEVVSKDENKSSMPKERNINCQIALQSAVIRCKDWLIGWAVVIARWICLYLPSCGPRFEAQHLRFYKVQLNCNVKRTKISKKRGRDMLILKNDWLLMKLKDAWIKYTFSVEISVTIFCNISSLSQNLEAFGQFRGCIKYLAKFWTYFDNFCILLGKLLSSWMAY